MNPRTKHKVTLFQYRVYDLVSKIPKGQVTSYKILSDTLKSAPRAVGQALKVNPFCPNPVPCHRVIAANGTIGGFSGQTGDCVMIANKKAKLVKEGIVFENGLFKQNQLGTTDLFQFK
ncbi:6-O-methylguanine DNA methyltransferase [Pilobolus umbonatus]|nr:6-O-methylguanine DNA methyltransferase [Pilobolus umbonatus]KAI8978135.1 6-O-methylguanine DNA methyltransferase [Pilobolus umbonatus]